MNLSTVRRSEPELGQLIATEALEGRVVHVRDRFGDYGLVGLLLFREEDQTLVIDTMLLSCRAMGRGVEHAMLREVAALAIMRQTHNVSIHYASTRKNAPAAALLASLPEAKRTSDGYRIGAAQLANFQFKPNQPIEPAAETTTQPAAVSHGDYAAIAALKGDPRRLLAILDRPIAIKTLLVDGTVTEQRLAAIWAGMLPVTSLDLDDDFFDLGGHSLLAVQLLTRIRETFGVELSLDLVYSNKLTIRRLAAIIDNGGTIPDEDAGTISDEEYAALLAEVEGLTEEEIQALLRDGQ